MPSAAGEQSARARALAREKAERVQANEKFQKVSAGATEFYSSAEVWKTEAKTRHRDKLIIAGLSFAAAMLLGMMFMYEWMTYVPPVPVAPPPPRDTSSGGVGETGQIAALTHEPVWVYLNERYAHPVVLAGVVSSHELAQQIAAMTAVAGRAAGVSLPAPVLKLEERNWLLGVQQHLQLMVDLNDLPEIPGLDVHLSLNHGRVERTALSGTTTEVSWQGWRWNPLGLGAVVILMLLISSMVLQVVRRKLGFGFPELPS